MGKDINFSCLLENIPNGYPAFFMFSSYTLLWTSETKNVETGGGALRAIKFS